MKNIPLSALRIDITIPRSFIYKDLGFVTNAHNVYEMLAAAHGYKPDRKEGKGARAYYCSFSHSINHHCYTLYTHTGNTIDDLLTRGHEETHFLDDIDQLWYLECELAKNGFDIDLGKFSEEERADIGGFYALIANGFDPFTSISEVRDEVKAFLANLAEDEKNALNALRASSTHLR